MSKVKLKFCGITRIQDYQKAVELKADYTGFIFYHPSPRHISVKDAAEIVRSTNATHQKVGIFVNANLKEVQNTIEEVGLDIVQLHGDENPHFANQLTYPFWKVVHIDKQLDMLTESLNTQNYNTNYFLLDKKSKKQYGGTGQSFEWERIPSQLWKKHKIILAGGLKLNNLKSALQFQPYALDINSGVESTPGIKDHTQMEKVTEVIHRYNQDQQ